MGVGPVQVRVRNTFLRQMERTASIYIIPHITCLLSEAKHGRAWLVLGLETTWEYWVL